MSQLLESFPIPDIQGLKFLMTQKTRINISIYSLSAMLAIQMYVAPHYKFLACHEGLVQDVLWLKRIKMYLYLQ